MSAPPAALVSRFGGLFVLFFLSGVSGLIYESIWSRYVRQFVGSAATAQVLVLSLFMGGMSLGALLAGRFLHRLRSPVAAYGLIEGAIGIYALIFPWLFEAVVRFGYDQLFPAVGGGDAVGLAKWGLAIALVLPPCVLLGTTFPLMSVGILRRDAARSGEILSVLYFTNSLGAALGALLSGFVLVGTVGLPGTLAVAAALNLMIFVVAIRDRERTAPIEGPRSATAERSARRPGWVWLFLAVAFGTGLSSFMYEIGWIRLLSMILGSATHSFEVMLSAFVFGLALGGLWVRKRMDRFTRPELVLGLVQVVMGLSAIATMPAYLIAVYVVGGIMGLEDRGPLLWYLFNVVRYLLCLLIMLPATFCAGMTLPLLTHVMLRRGQAEAVVGQIYGVNTLGAIAGAVLAGIVLLPLIGLKLVLIAGAAIDMVLGLVLIHREVTRTDALRVSVGLFRRAGVAAVAATAMGAVFRVDPMVLSATVFRNGRTRLPEEYRLLSYVDGRTASVSVIANDDHPGYHIIYTNGKPDASVVLDPWPASRPADKGPDIAGDEPNQLLVGLIPLMARPDARDVALIGFGSGVTCHVILGSPVLERLDTIEIEREMVRGSSYFHPINHRAYEDPRNHIYFDDAKAYFAAAANRYDIIVSEPTNPWVSGVASLFTTEFYREAKRYLKPGGILAQWLQGYELSDELLITVLTALDREFQDYVVLRIGSRDWVILSSPDAEIGQLATEPLAWAGMADSLKLLGIHDIGQIDGLITANRRMLHPFLADTTPNTDALPLLDVGAERCRFDRSSAEFLHSIRWTPAPLVEVLGDLRRRPYPRAGIGDLRDPHVLRETEQAMLLMRAFENRAERVPEDTSAQAMLSWHEAEDAVKVAAAPSWEPWLRATYGVYAETASHFDVHRSAWWAQVRRTVAERNPPEDVRLAVEVMDAMSAKDPVRLRPAVDAALAGSESVLPRPLLTIAGVVALELEGADADARHAFVERHMDTIGDGPDSEDYAYRAIRAFAAR